MSGRFDPHQAEGHPSAKDLYMKSSPSPPSQESGQKQSNLTDQFSSFIYGASGTPLDQNNPSMQDHVTVDANNQVFDVFASIDSQIPYRDNGMAAFGFLPQLPVDLHHVVPSGHKDGHHLQPHIHSSPSLPRNDQASRRVPDTYPTSDVTPQAFPQRQATAGGEKSQEGAQYSLRSITSIQRPPLSFLPQKDSSAWAYNPEQYTSKKHKQPQMVGDPLVSPFSAGEQRPSLESEPISPDIFVPTPQITVPESSKPQTTKKPTKTLHNIIEKRYRVKLNAQLLSLKNAVPALRTAALSSEDEPGRGVAKARVLEKATEYIHQLEREKRELEQQVLVLKDEVERLKAKPGQGFEWGGVAASEHVNGRVPSSGMISPESCTSLMSPEAEGTLF